ncbi:MAG: hydroxymethylglutaryl-CoA reductase [Patescibacteria group bacterium]
MLAIKKTVLAKEMVEGKNCENFIGATQVPLGTAGPLKIVFDNQKRKEYTLPLSTTEGALVASVNRGCKATHSSGIKTYVQNIGATRGPIFRVKDISQARKLVTFVENNLPALNKIIRKKEKHITLLKVKSQILGKNIWLRFYFDTSEAMGMNMVTIASDEISTFLQKKFEIKCLSLSGNFCSDKKPSWANFIFGRGKKVWAEARIKKETVKKVLKTNSQNIVDVVKQKSHLGSIITGSMGFNAHYANIIAALFLSTGQDLAHVVEGAMGITDAEVEKNGDLFFSIYLPDVMVGTVGGGTHLPTQKEALKILGLDSKKKGDSLIFAQIVGAAVLAGELSLTAALASNHLAKAHQKLGRGKK